MGLPEQPHVNQAAGRRVRAGLLLAAAAALAAGLLALRRARLEPMLVQGDSMLPALPPGAKVAVGPVRDPVARGAVVVLAHPLRPGLEVVKRVVGLPGERVRVAGWRVEVDGQPLAEPWVRAPAGARPAPGPDPFPDEGELDVRLGPGEYLVLGDNRARSSDGRAFGPVSRERLVGLVRFPYWPPRLLARWLAEKMGRNAGVCPR